MVEENKIWLNQQKFFFDSTKSYQNKLSFVEQQNYSWETTKSKFGCINQLSFWAWCLSPSLSLRNFSKCFFQFLSTPSTYPFLFLLGLNLRITFQKSLDFLLFSTSFQIFSHLALLFSLHELINFLDTNWFLAKSSFNSE